MNFEPHSLRCDIQMGFDVARLFHVANVTVWLLTAARNYLNFTYHTTGKTPSPKGTSYRPDYWKSKNLEYPIIGSDKTFYLGLSMIIWDFYFTVVNERDSHKLHGLVVHVFLLVVDRGWFYSRSSFIAQ